MTKRILLVEDNPVSREFLHEALKSLPVSIDVADTFAGARLLARRHEHVLFLCDVHLPDGGPQDIFQGLNQCQANAALVAITAEAGSAACASLLEIGYQEVWGKPITMKALQINVSRLLGIKCDAGRSVLTPELWDDTSALRAVGDNAATLAALRRMFLAELPQQMKTIRFAYENKDKAALKGECHKLMASCGFVGAARLTQTVTRLSENPEDQVLLQSVLIEADNCLTAD